jgi:hypothetical protein
MNPVLPGFDIDDVHCSRSDDDPNLFYYIPAAPGPELAPSGRPTLSLMVSGQTGILQFGVRWAVDPQTLEAVRAAISQKFPPLSINLIRLVPAPVSVIGVTLQITDGSKLQDITTVSSSDYPPYTALVNVPLDAASVARAISAINGNKSLLVVRYDVSLSVQNSVLVTIKGDLKSDLAAMDKAAELGDCQKQIDEAIQAGRLLVQHSGDSARDELRRQAYDSAVQKAAMFLFQLLRAPRGFPDSAFMEVSASAADTQSVSLAPLTDLGTWISSGQGGDFIHLVNGQPLRAGS